MQDKIAKTIDIKASIDKVWQALTDHQEFGSWFRVNLQSPFEVGEITTGVMQYPGCEGTPFWAEVISKDPMNYFSFRWPYDESIVPSPGLTQKTTLVEFRLQTIEIGTRLTVTESQLSNIPDHRRLSFIRDNTSGWNIQTENVKHYVEQ